MSSTPLAYCMETGALATKAWGFEAAKAMVGTLGLRSCETLHARVHERSMSNVGLRAPSHVDKQEFNFT